MNKSNQTSESKLAGLSYSKAWWLITTAIAVAIVLGLGALDLVRLLAVPLAVLIFGLTLAAALAPMVAWLERRMPRPLAILLVYLLVIVLLVALVWAIVPSLVQQVQDLGNRMPDLIERARQFINRWRGNLTGDSFTNTLFSQLSNLGSLLLRLPLAVSTAIFNILLILFISFYILLETSGMQRFLLSLFPEERRPRINELVTTMAQAMGGYIRGVVINGVIVGALTFVGLLIIGVDFALAFGVMAGLFELVPVAGPIIAGLIIVGLTFLQSPGQALAALIFMVILQQVENNVLVPHIMRSQTDVSPLISILALFAGGAIGGLMGALIAIPIAAVLRVLIRQVLAPAIRRQTGAEPQAGSTE